MRVRFDLNIDDRAWWRIAEHAEAAGVRVPEFMLDSVIARVGEVPPASETKPAGRPVIGRRPTVNRRKFSTADNDEIRRLAMARINQKTIAYLFNARTETIHMKLTRWGLLHQGNQERQAS